MIVVAAILNGHTIYLVLVVGQSLNNRVDCVVAISIMRAVIRFNQMRALH